MIQAKRNSFDRIVAMVLSIILVLAMIPVSTLQALAVPADVFSVTVTDGASPISGAEVEIKNSTEQWELQLTATTDENGIASFQVSEIEAAMAAAMVDYADISIRVIAEGYAQKTGSVPLNAAAIAQEVTLELDKTGNLTPETRYAVNTSANIPEGGIVSPKTETVAAGDSVTIHATANAGYAIESILVNGNPDTQVLEEN